MSDLKIAVILGNTRPGRDGKAVADWVVDRAGARTGTDFENISVFKPGEQHDAAAVLLFDQIESWARVLKAVRVRHLTAW